jgi:hypothetical protein
VKAFKNGAIQRTKTEQKMRHAGAFLKLFKVIKQY